MTPTPAGERNKRVTILNRSTTTNGLGEDVADADTTGATVWAKVEVLSGRELVAAAQNTGDVTHRVTFKYTPDVTRKDKLQFKGRTFHIEALTNMEEANIELVALCREQT